MPCALRTLQTQFPDLVTSTSVMDGMGLGVGWDTDWEGEHRGFEVMGMLCCVLNVTGVTRVYPFAKTH